MKHLSRREGDGYGPLVNIRFHVWKDRNLEDYKGPSLAEETGINRCWEKRLTGRAAERGMLALWSCSQAVQREP